jgi:catechol 2,3-dioxygenase-like lactoylglutathione lyase family enzyme
MKAKLDHVGILGEQLEDSLIDLYCQVFGCEKPKYFRGSNEDEEMDYVYLPLPRGDNYVELLAAVRGPSQQLLEKKGAGTMSELCVEVDNIEDFYDEMKTKGITLCDPMGRPLPESRKWCSIPGDDNKYSYLSEDKTFGTTIEILERNTWKRSTYW